MNTFTETTRDKALYAMQRIELEGLQEIDRICRKHGIKYSLGGGTCLGQYRHGGFIPWDDDIDVDMTVENYDKFMEVAPKELEGTKFFLRCRKTDPTHLRSAARLENTETHISIPRWDSGGKTGTGIFVDIFRWNYLPDDEQKRKKVASKLFYLHCMQSYKEYHKFAAMLDPHKRFGLRVFSSIIPESLVEKKEDRLINTCKGKTGWIIDDAIIHGDHGGYPSAGIDEYEDVEFEGITVMNKKNSVNFLKTIYGDHFNEWLPPAGRISHHTWTDIDLGKYAEEFGLDESYKDCMTIKYSFAKLKQMKVVSDMIVDEVRRVCEKYDIKYNIATLTEKAVMNSFPEINEVWTGPVKFLMLRKEYEKFAGICQKELGKKYFFQSHETEPEYYYEGARVRLNLTSIHDRKLRVSIEKELHDGFFVEIMPLDDCPEKGSADFVRNVKRLRREAKVKWVTQCFNTFYNLPMEDKKSIIRNRKYTLDEVFDRYIAAAHSCEDKDTGLCFDSSMRMGGKIFKKKELEGKIELPFLNKGTYKAKNIEEFIEGIWGDYGACYLNYYDIPDYQLSILRYDEKEDRLLSTEEIIERTEV